MPVTREPYEGPSGIELPVEPSARRASRLRPGGARLEAILKIDSMQKLERGHEVGQDAPDRARRGLKVCVAI